MTSATTSDALVVVHHHPGRLRVRARLLERDGRLRSSLARALSRADGVLATHARAETGSILVEYDPDRIDAGALLEQMAVATRLSVVRPAPREGSVAPAVFRAVRAIDGGLFAWTGGRFDLRVGVPAALGVGSIASFLWSGHRRAPRWDNLLYWAVTFFWTLNEARAEPLVRSSDGAS